MCEGEHVTHGCGDRQLGSLLRLAHLSLPALALDDVLARWCCG
jgi:hypothetical protein